MNDIMSKRIKTLREESGMTQSAFAKALGIGFTQNLISKYEGGTYPSIDKLIAIAKFCGVSTDWVLGLTEDRGNNNSPIDAMGLDDETVSVLKAMVAEELSNFEAQFTEEAIPPNGKLWSEGIYLNRILQSEYLRPLLFALNDLERVARKCISIKTANEKDLKELKRLEKRFPIISDPQAIIDENVSKAVSIARSLIRSAARIDECEQLLSVAHPEEDVGVTPPDVRAVTMKEALIDFYKRQGKSPECFGGEYDGND